MERVVCSLVFLNRGSRVYLARGKKGVSRDFFNGYGGKIEPGETIIGNAIRETRDEGGVRVEASAMRKACVVVYHWPVEIPGLGRPNARALELHVFVANNWRGEPQETDSFTKPQPFNRCCMPYDQMLPDVSYWLPKVLITKTAFTAEIWYKQASSGSVTPIKYLPHPTPDQALINAP